MVTAMGQLLGTGVYNENGVSAVAKESGVMAKHLENKLHDLRFEHDETQKPGTFVNLDLLPTELALNVLSHLNATDLCLASCVWYNLGCDDVLWQDLCRRNWPFCSFYKKGLPPGSTYRQLYLRLDEARLTFRADAFDGLNYLFKYGLLDDNFNDIVEFFHTAPGLDPVQKCRLFHSRPQLLYGLLDMKDFTSHFLPNALRRLFSEFPVPTTDSASFEFITLLVGKFAERFAACNSVLGLSTDEIYLLCFSLIMLSVDLWSPHVKNKMSKREFIRNARRVIGTVTSDFLGHLYDNVYMVGHVVLGNLTGPPTRQPSIRDIL